MNKKLIGIFLALFIVLAFGVGVYAYNIWDKKIDIDKIYPGVYIDNIDVSNKTTEEAIIALKEVKEEDKNKEILLYTKDNSYTMTLDEIGYDYNYEEAVEEAYNIGKEGSFLNRYNKIIDLEKNNVNIDLVSSYDEEKIVKLTRTISNNVFVPSIDAKIYMLNGKFVVEDESEGYEVDEEALKEKILSNLDKDEIEMPVNVVSPKYTKESYSRINGVIGKATTRFDNSGQGRKENIKISGNSLDGQVLHPGETLSYNSITGPRQRQFGYQEAPVILNGQYTPGVGGGVCQTSTTLYNAILDSDLDIVERYHHSIPPPYVKKGTDAVVNDGNLDLKFRNDYDFPVYIKTDVTNNYITITIYGDTTVKDYNVVIEPQITETIPCSTVEKNDPNLYIGERVLDEKGRDGYKVSTYKITYKNGQVIDKKLITSDYYKPKNYVYRVGTKEGTRPVVEEEKGE